MRGEGGGGRITNISLGGERKSLSVRDAGGAEPENNQIHEVWGEEIKGDNTWNHKSSAGVTVWEETVLTGAHR